MLKYTFKMDQLQILNSDGSIKITFVIAYIVNNTT
jgi:hypothetical protein